MIIPEETVTFGKKWRLKFRNFTSFPSICWIMLWFSINTGPWVLRSRPENIIEGLHWVRTLFPLIVLGSSVILLLTRHTRIKLPGNVKQWLFYGLIGLSACMLSPGPFDAAFWGIAYLSAFAIMNSYIGEKDMLDNVIHLNILSLLIVTVFLLVLVFFSWDVLYVDTAAAGTVYGYENRMPMVAGMPMSISSGLARFAAVPGVLSFVFIWFGKGWRRFLWIAPFLFFGWIIYIMQSRGAVIGFTFVIAFEMLFLGGRKRIAGIFLLLLFGAMLVSNALPGEFFSTISDYMRRGQNIDELKSMTGRTFFWQLGWKEVLDAPLIGRGFQADRFLIGEHIHNTYLYALMTSGFIGTTAFVSGLLWSWRLFFRAIKRKYEDDSKHNIFLIQTGGILAFFTVRGITEVSGPLFNVDFMVMLPIIAYLGILDGKYHQGTKLIFRW
jgi:O-antigen ligase